MIPRQRGNGMPGRLSLNCPAFLNALAGYIQPVSQLLVTSSQHVQLQYPQVVQLIDPALGRPDSELGGWSCRAPSRGQTLFRPSGRK